MRVSTLRALDKWAGIALALVLTGVRKLRQWLGSSEAAPVRSILFVKLAEQGSTVLAHGALLRAAEMVGRENVYFLVFAENRFILDTLGVIPESNVIAIKTGSLIPLLFSTLQAIHRMRTLELDAAVDLEFFARASAVFSFLSGAKVRVGFHAHGGGGPYRGDLMTHRLVYNPHLHTAQTFELMVEALNHPAELFPAFATKAPPVGHRPLPQFTPHKAEVDHVRTLLCRRAKTQVLPPIILLNANCSDLLPLRKWDGENYVSLAKRLLTRYEDLYIAFTGDASERRQAEQLVQRVDSRRCFSLAGKTTLRQLLVLYGESQVLVTNDSGPAHFASLTTIDAVTLFGPETPALFAAPSQRSHIIWAATVCSPCVNAYNNRLLTCRNNLCMQLITVDEVFAKVCALYERRMTRQ